MFISNGESHRKKEEKKSIFFFLLIIGNSKRPQLLLFTKLNVHSLFKVNIHFVK